MTMKERSWSAHLTVFAPIVWGTTYVTITEFLPSGRPLLVATLRVAPAGLVLVLIGALRSQWLPTGREWGRLALLGVFNFGLFFPLLFVAVYRLPGGVAAAVGGLQPMLVAMLSWVLNARRPRIVEVAIGCVAMIGVSLVVVRPGASIDALGVAAAVAANVVFATGVVLTKRFPPPIDRLATTGWQLLLGGTVLAPLAMIVEGSLPDLTARNVAGFAYLSLVGTGLAYVVWFTGVRRLPTAAPPLLGLAAPVTGAALGWAVLGEDLSPLQLVGFAVTIGAIAYGGWLGSRSIS
jgi:probable blue pigment (indigoidine) exporter